MSVEPGTYDYLLKPIRPDAPRDFVRREALDDLIERRQRKVRKGATLTSPLPTPPERGGGSPRVRIEIEIVERRGGPPPAALPALQSVAYRLGRVVFWLIVLCVALALVGCAHAQSTQYQSYQQGFNTMTDGSDGTHARSYTQGFQTLTDITLPDGSVRHCMSYRQSFNTVTECNE